MKLLSPCCRIESVRLYGLSGSLQVRKCNGCGEKFVGYWMWVNYTEDSRGEGAHILPKTEGKYVVPDDQNFSTTPDDWREPS